MTPATGPPRWRTARQRRGVHAPPFEAIQYPLISITISRATCALIGGLMARRTTVTINDVANEAGVALGTVSNAFNHPEKVRPETLKRINEASAKLGYAPNQSARMLAGGQNRSFGLVLPSLEHGISLQIANGANAEAQKHGYGLLIANADNDDILSARYLTYFMGTQMAGILVQPMSVYGWKPSLATPSVPTVYLDFHSSEPGYFVGADNRAQGRLVAQHAIDAGARRIAVFGKDEFEKLGMRIAGVRDIMHTAAGVAFEFIDEGAWNLARDGYSVGYRLAKRPASERPDFIIALSDVLATGAVAGIQAAGLSVPGDIKVAGSDGNPLAWSGNVPLTTIAPPGYEIGRKGVQYLIAQIEENRRAGNAMPTENHQALVRPFLLARASSGEGNATEFADPDLDISGYL